MPNSLAIIGAGRVDERWTPLRELGGKIGAVVTRSDASARRPFVIGAGKLAPE